MGNIGGSMSMGTAAPTAGSFSHQSLVGAGSIHPGVGEDIWNTCSLQLPSTVAGSSPIAPTAVPQSYHSQSSAALAARTATGFTGMYSSWP